MLQAEFTPYTLNFKRPGGTSRGVLTTKETWFVKVFDDENPEIYGEGECALFRGLGCDDRPEYEEMIASLAGRLPATEELPHLLKEYPSILFGLETALADLSNGGKGVIFPSDFADGTDSIQINGLIWMGTIEEMNGQIKEKLNMGFTCLKLKIGAIDFEAEMELLKSIREKYKAKTLELRVDANGAFLPQEAMEKLERLSRFDIHSIEQPIRAGQWEDMARICRTSPIPVALDEELIGINDTARKQQLLDTIRPQYIILKPSLHGGFAGSDEWITLAGERQINWWATSALESNIGLNAIAQWCYNYHNPLPQGLGTGQLFTNNRETKLRLLRDLLYIHHR